MFTSARNPGTHSSRRSTGDATGGGNNVYPPSITDSGMLTWLRKASRSNHLSYTHLLRTDACKTFRRICIHLYIIRDAQRQHPSSCYNMPPRDPPRMRAVQQQQPQTPPKGHAHHTTHVSALVPGTVLLAALPDLANGLKAAVTGTYLTNAGDGSCPAAGASPVIDEASQKPLPVSSERTASRVAGRGMVKGSS